MFVNWDLGGTSQNKQNKICKVVTELSVSLHITSHLRLPTPHTLAPSASAEYRWQHLCLSKWEVSQLSTLPTSRIKYSNLHPTCLYISPGGGARRVMARYVIIYCPPRLGDRYLDIFRHTLTSGRHFLGAATCYKYKYQACQLWNDLLATTLHCATNETLCCRLVSVKRCLTIPQLVDNIPSIKWRQLV